MLIALRNPKVFAFFSKVYYLVISWFPLNSALILCKFAGIIFKMKSSFISLSTANNSRSTLPYSSKRWASPLIILSKYFWENKLFPCLVTPYFCMIGFSLASMMSGPTLSNCGTMAVYFIFYIALFFHVIWLGWQSTRQVYQELYTNCHLL